MRVKPVPAVAEPGAVTMNVLACPGVTVMFAVLVVEEYAALTVHVPAFEDV